jgi:hypothetical protein
LRSRFRLTDGRLFRRSFRSPRRAAGPLCTYCFERKRKGRGRAGDLAAELSRHLRSELIYRRNPLRRGGFDFPAGLRTACVMMSFAGEFWRHDRLGHSLV